MQCCPHDISMRSVHYVGANTGVSLVAMTWYKCSRCTYMRHVYVHKHGRRGTNAFFARCFTCSCRAGPPEREVRLTSRLSRLTHHCTPLVRRCRAPLNALHDELHCTLECPHLSNTRLRYPTLFGAGQAGNRHAPTPVHRCDTLRAAPMASSSYTAFLLRRTN
jgi:hypothetical protein